MMEASEVKKLAMSLGADDCGIAGADRFTQSPEGFHPRDVYKKCKSVIALIKTVPSDIIHADSPGPYTHSAHVIFSELDLMAINLCRELEKRGAHGVPVPCDTPYEYYDAERMHGMGILSMRHVAYLSGLGVLGKNTLFIHRKFGNMVYIGAVLTDLELAADPMVEETVCPPNCRICLDACQGNALDGVTVNQAICRTQSIRTNAKGYAFYVCTQCRKVCPNRLGFKTA